MYPWLADRSFPPLPEDTWFDFPFFGMSDEASEKLIIVWELSGSEDSAYFVIEREDGWLSELCSERIDMYLHNALLS